MSLFSVRKVKMFNLTLETWFRGKESASLE